MSRAVNKRLCVVKKTFRKIFGIDRLWLDFNSNTNRTKRINTYDLYYIKFHTQMFVYRSWPDLIRHRDIVYYVYGMCVCTEVSKTIDMYAFLFNDILLLTKIKKPPRKVRLFGCFFWYL